MEASIFLKDVMNMIKRYYWVILLLGLVGGLIGRYVVSEGPAPTYQTSSPLLVERQINDDANIYINQSDENARFLNTVQTLLRKEVILKVVKKDLLTEKSVKEISEKITVINENNSQIIKITVEDQDPILATDLANTLTKVFVNEVDKYLEIENITIVENAIKGQETKISHSRARANTTMGILVGLIIGSFMAFVLNKLIPKVR